ncbi:MAG: AAA family ATPase [Treponema sp.]|nr:AAA family ATPase [Treponema sp.]
MKFDFEEFKSFCISPGSPTSNKANSYVQAIRILFGFLNINSEELDSSDYKKIQELYKSLSNKRSSGYLGLLDFVSVRNQKSYLESGFISAAIGYFNKYYENKEGNMTVDNNVQKSSEAKEYLLETRYIHSLLAKPFVILTGNSGTGKTRIATQFAESLEKQIDFDNTNRLLIPVGADWTDNTKILGYYNPLADGGTGKYEKTPIIEFIERAVKYPDIPFFLILDEMNLSHVERYFSDFLSKMELVDYKNSNKEVYFDIPGYGQLLFPKNLFITGTVNIDETTYMFSPKVLDRANVIEFKPEMKNVLDNLLDGSDGGQFENDYFDTPEDFIETANKVRSGDIPNDVTTSLEEIRKILEEFYKELEKAGFEFAYRTVKEIRLYAIASYETFDGEIPASTEIADIQILQKILPKIHGNRKQIGDLLDHLETLCTKYFLKKSHKKIDQMKDKLNRFQYASFI